MYGLCMGFGVHTALLGLIQLGSVTEGFKLCWRTGQSARLETILFDTRMRKSDNTNNVYERSNMPPSHHW